MQTLVIFRQHSSCRKIEINLERRGARLEDTVTRVKETWPCDSTQSMQDGVLPFIIQAGELHSRGFY